MSICFRFLRFIYSIFSINLLKIILKWSLASVDFYKISFHQLMNKKNVMKMIRMQLQLYGMTVSEKIVGNVPLNWNKVASKFLQFTNNHIRVNVTGKRVNRGVELELKIPVNYFFMEMQEL